MASSMETRSLNGCTRFSGPFFRVVMHTLTQWMMFPLPAGALVYSLACGLAEMVILGLLFALVLRPST